MENPIVLAAGGTGGHVMPAQALAEAIEKSDISVHFLIDQRVESLFADQAWSRSVLPLRHARYRSLSFWVQMIRSTCQAWAILKKIRPQAVIAFGGYCTLPTAIAAVVLGIPVYLHEQNAVLGRAHQFLLPFAKRLFLSFTGTRCVPNAKQSRCVVTGNPVRSKFFEDSKKTIKKKDAFFHILVLGGSQGAALFSDLLPKSLALLPETVQKNISLVHQCRDALLVDTQKAYEDFPGLVELKPFFKDIASLMMDADLIITRAGASTLAELSVLGKKALFIPLETAVYDHQTENARLQCDQGRGWMMGEKKISSQLLAAFIEDFYANLGRESGVLIPTIERPQDLILASLGSDFGLTEK